MNNLHAAAQAVLYAWDTRAGIAEASAAFEKLRTALAQAETPVAWLVSPYGVLQMNRNWKPQFPPQTTAWKIPLYLGAPDVNV